MRTCAELCGAQNRAKRKISETVLSSRFKLLKETTPALGGLVIAELATREAEIRFSVVDFSFMQGWLTEI
jgi:hypothetical protein